MGLIKEATKTGRQMSFSTTMTSLPEYTDEKNNVEVVYDCYKY